MNAKGGVSLDDWDSTWSVCWAFFWLLPAVQPAMDALRRQAGFYISDAVAAHVLVLAGE